jgi:hypothetical protein
MPDITMCDGGDCPNKDSCHRFTATPSAERQAYFTEPPWKEGEPCRHFDPIRLGSGWSVAWMKPR